MLVLNASSFYRRGEGRSCRRTTQAVEPVHDATALLNCPQTLKTLNMVNTGYRECPLMHRTIGIVVAGILAVLWTSACSSGTQPPTPAVGGISAGFWHSCALRQDGEAVYWVSRAERTAC